MRIHCELEIKKMNITYTPNRELINGRRKKT
jgi:hypothetical protein